MRTSALLLLSGILLLAASPAVAATPDDVADGLLDGVFVEDPGDADASRLADLVESARIKGVELSIVVLRDEFVDAVGFANDLGGLRAGTVMVFTPAQYGVSSNEVSQEQLDVALEAAAADLSGLNTAAGVEAFIAALPVASEEESSTNWPVAIGAALVVLVVVGVVGRTIERRATSGRRQRALERTWTRLKKRADGVADPILELSTPVELLANRDVTATYREASALFDRVRRRVDGEPVAREVDELTKDMDRLDDLMARVTSAVNTRPEPAGDA